MPRRAAAPAKRDPYAVITDRIIAALDHGTVPWRRPWQSRGLRNAVSGHLYRGINLLLLGLTALERGFDDPRWLTYRQALAKGGHVRRGEQGTPVVFWKWIERSGTDADEPAQHIPLLRMFTVFNVRQCEDLTLPSLDLDGAPDPIAAADAIVVGYAGGPPVLHDADCAYYVPARDEVHLPPRAAFAQAHGYYATLFHELAHSTGHPRRLSRDGYQSAARFGSETYSREELVAEFAAAFLAHEAGIDPSGVDQSAAYIASWLHALRDDRRLAVVSAAQAQHAADHILGRDPEAIEAITNRVNDDDGTVELPAICRRLLAWAATMGGWDAPVWRDLRAAVDRVSAVAPTVAIGDRVLRLHIEGTLDMRVPDDVDEHDASWDAWLDGAIQTALLDGRWQDCTGVGESEVGVLDEHGEVRRV